MNYNELLKALEEFYENIPEEEREYDEPLTEFAYDEGGKVLNEEIGWMTEVHQESGSGEGEHWESVKHFPKHDIYIKITGFTVLVKEHHSMVGKMIVLKFSQNKRQLQYMKKKNK